MNEEIMTTTEVTEAQATDVVETNQATGIVEESKSLGKDVAEMAVIGLVIYVFCKAVDKLIDGIKAGIKKFKESRKAKKAQQAAPAQGAPVANVQQQTETTTQENAEQK